MRVHFIDVGQADSTFIELGNGQTMLIDAGLGGDDVVKYIKDLQYSDIDFVVATHPHDDHIGGMATVLDSFDIGKMYMPRQEHTISAFTNDTIKRPIKQVFCIIGLFAVGEFYTYCRNFKILSLNVD